MSGRAVALALLLGLLSGFYGTAKYKDATWGALVAEQSSLLNQKLRVETERVLAAERRARELNDSLEVNNGKAKRHIDGLLAENLRLAAELGGMRDPGTTFRGAAPGAEVAPTVDPGSTPAGRLSVEAEKFLLAEAHRADDVHRYAELCYQWANDPDGGVKP